MLTRSFHHGSKGPLYVGRNTRFMNTRSISLGESVGFGPNSRVECYPQHELSVGPCISIGSNTSFGDFSHIGAINHVYIGSYVLGGSNILIIDHTHGFPKDDMQSQVETPPRLRPLHSKGAITIEDSVWLCDGCVILAGAHIGKGAIISAGSVVSSNVAPYTIHSGGS